VLAYHGCFGLLIGVIYSYFMLRPFLYISRIPGRNMVNLFFMLRFTAAGIAIGIALQCGFDPIAVLPCFLIGYAAGTTLFIRRIPVA